MAQRKPLFLPGQAAEAVLTTAAVVSKFFNLRLTFLSCGALF
jgi:hypothetical protein